MLNGATLGNASAPGFGTALNTDTGVTSAFGILALKPFLAADATDNAPANFAWFGADGAFTLEALVKLDVLPVSAPGGSLGVITMDGDSNERIFNLRIEKSATPALNFLVLPNSGVNPSATGYQAAIPLTGPHALATNVWFHVAVTYNGNAGASNNLALYWTLLDAGITAANLIGSNSLPADFTDTNGDFALGNDARAGSGENEVFDHDGLPDSWEQFYFGSLAQTAAGDPDGDGLGNLHEFLNGLLPALVANPGDTDGDGLPDAWEMQHFGDLTQTASGDYDRDGVGNLQEYQADSSPANPNSIPGDINGGSFQADILITFNGYQYTAWYDNVGSTTSAQTVWLARRTIDKTRVGAWQAVSTGSIFVNGKASWDAHNVISLGISPVDGTLHMAWDHHVNTLRYRRSVTGLCTTNTTAWGASMMNAEQPWLVTSGQTQTGVTYPCFFNSPTGDLIFEYRNGGSGGGDTGLQYYNPATGNWNARWQFVTRNGTFFGISNTTGTNVTSTARNAYDNGFDFAPDGTLHYTWTFREKNGAFNHDIDYAFSTNGGVTWQNNVGATIADKNNSSQISVTSPGISMKVMDGTQAMINQQAQCVDGEGRVHVLMSHRRPEPGFEWQSGDSAFGGADRAYYHYFRDPVTYVWSQPRLPTTYAVGSRPKVGYDLRGNVYVVFNSGGWQRWFDRPATCGWRTR